MALLTCSTCGRTHPVDPATWRCACGGVLDLTGPSGIVPVDLGAAPTALLALRHDAIDLHAKVEGTLPSGSFKDRGAAQLVGLLAAHGVERAVADSSGNAGAAIAAHCARAGIALDLYVPEAASPGKLVQARLHGARVHAVPGTRQAAADAAAAAVAAGAIYATHAWSPLFREGTRSFAVELLAQLGRAPDVLVLPVGSGTLLLGVWDALCALSRPPRLVAVQSAACAPLAVAFAAGADEPATVAPTPGAAEGVLVARPPRGAQALAAIRASGGTVLALADDAIGPALRALGARGIFAEPTAALALAAIAPLLAAGTIAPGETVVLAITGHGLKAPGAVAELG